MIRKEALRLILTQAQFNGFRLRRWFKTHVQPLSNSQSSAVAQPAGAAGSGNRWPVNSGPLPTERMTLVRR